MVKKIIIAILIIILAIGGFFVYKVFNPSVKSLGVEVTDKTVTSAQEKLGVQLPSTEQLNEGELLVPSEEKVYTEATLDNAEASVLMNSAFSTIIPVSNLQALLQDDNKIEMSMMMKLTDELKTAINAPIPLPEKASAYVVCKVTTENEEINVKVISSEISGTSLPSSLVSQIEGSIASVLKGMGFKEINISSGAMEVKGDLPASYN